MDIRAVCALGAVLAAGCVSREEGIAAAAFADSGGTFLGALASYVPTSQMFGGAYERSDLRVRLFEQAPRSAERTPVGAEIREEVTRLYFMRTAGYVLYQSAPLGPFSSPDMEQGTWTERALADGTDRVVSAPGNRPAGFDLVDMVPSWTGAYRAVVFQSIRSGTCRLEVQARATGHTVFTRAEICTTGLWQPDDSLLFFNGGEDGGSFKVKPPAWMPEPVDPQAPSPCTLGTSSGISDPQGRTLVFSPRETEVTVMTEGKVFSCLDP
ncbi:MAG: hypothetical protein FJ086_18195 [Deltaproteobacteria bacterium]|nr:hypothetical protein [Deltaproteobacteria bacterium]